MFVFILRRLIQALVVMVCVALIAFMLFQYVGDPVVTLLGQDALPEQIAQLRADPDLAPLRADPRFEGLLSRFERAEAPKGFLGLF